MGEKRVVLGRVSGLYGVKGWVKLHSFTEPPENLLEYRDLELGQAGRWRPVRLEEARPHGKGLVGRFAGVADRDAAAGLVDAELAVDRTVLPAASADEYYWADLVGLAVETVDGLPLGRVEHLIETGAHDVLVVSGERERLIPWVPGRYVTEVDLAGGRIVVDWDPEF